VPRPPVDLDGQPGGGEREVDQVRTERVAEHPSRDPAGPQQPDQQPLGRRVGSIRRRRDQRRGRRPAGAAQVAAVGAVQRREPQVPLQRAVQEAGAVRDDDGRLQRGQRPVGQPQVPDTDQIRVGQVATAESDARPGSQMALAPYGDLHDRGGPLEHAVPVGGCRTGDHGGLTAGPQPGCTDPRLVRQPLPADQVHTRVQAFPVPAAGPPLHRCRGEPAAHRLREGQHNGLPCQQPGQHPPSISHRTRRSNA
jgi:hypothetical protein